jgi:hypothetical protein
VSTHFTRVAETKAFLIKLEVNHANSDITLQSCDGVQFKVHRKNLECASEVFAGAHAISPTLKGEVVNLTEDSKVLDLLLQFMYPQPPPRLSTIDFDLVLLLADAALKYLAYSVMAFCEIAVCAAARSHPLAVLNYASKNNNIQLMDEVAPLTVNFPIDDVLAVLPLSLFATWVRYRQKWVDGVNAAYRTLDFRPRHNCTYQINVIITINSILSSAITALHEHDWSTLEVENMNLKSRCMYCSSAVETWRARAQTNAPRPVFSNLV